MRPERPQKHVSTGYRALPINVVNIAKTIYDLRTYGIHVIHDIHDIHGS